MGHESQHSVLVEKGWGQLRPWASIHITHQGQRQPTCPSARSMCRGFDGKQIPWVLAFVREGIGG
jgi:hypothetical protein